MFRKGLARPIGHGNEQERRDGIFQMYSKIARATTILESPLATSRRLRRGLLKQHLTEQRARRRVRGGGKQ